LRYRTYTLGELAQIKYGRDHKAVRDDENGCCPILGTGGVMGRATRPLCEGPSVLIGRKGSIGRVRYIDEPFWTVDTLFYTVVNERLVLPRYLYYLLSAQDMMWYNEGTTVPSLRTEMLEQIRLPVPDLGTQERVLGVLGMLDDRIGLNRRTAQGFEEQALTLYRLRYQPAEDALPTGWRMARLEEFFPVLTGRVDANIADEDGPYPFFTCGREVLRAGQWSFDGAAVLVAGNGEFSVKACEGKFEAYQRTYVLMPYDSALLGFLYYALKYNLPAITAGFRGSVVKFITKGDIAGFRIPAPPRPQEDAGCALLLENLRRIGNLRKHSAALASLRDALLPKLLSGEIEAPAV